MRPPLALAPAFLLYAAFFLFCFHEADEDLWGRMAAGRLAAAEGRVPLEDPFAYVPTRPTWVDHEWLAGRIFFEVYRRFSGAGLMVLNLALGLATLGFASGAATRAGGAPWARLATLLGVWPLLAHGFSSLLRAQAFSFALFAALLWLLERARQGKRGALALFLPLTAVWGNLHGGFVVGPLLMLVYGAAALVEGRRKDAALVTALAVLCFAATGANPYGTAYWSYLASALAMPRPYIVEWRAVRLLGWDDLHIKLALLLALWVVSRRLRGEAALCLLGVGAATLLHLRFTPFLALALIVFLPRPLEETFQKAASQAPRGKRLRRSLVPLALMLTLQLLVFLGAAISWPELRLAPALEVRTDRYPVAALAFMRERSLGGNLAVFFNWGEYALYHLYPACRVSFDGRLETVYPEEIIQLNLAFTDGKPEGRALLTDYPTDLALYPAGSGAHRLLALEPGFGLLYQDDTAVLYRREARGR